MDKYIRVPLTEETAVSLEAGDYVYLTGTIYTARDAAHKRMYEAMERGEQLPLDMKDNVIYYMGPSPARPGRPIGSAGPPTASRMDKYAPSIVSSEVIAYDDLGTEAIRRLEVKDFPVIVVMDSRGNNLYETAVRDYCREQ